MTELNKRAEISSIFLKIVTFLKEFLYIHYEIRQSSKWTDLACVLAIDTCYLQSLAWIYYPGHDGVWGNEQAELLAGKVPVFGTLMVEKRTIMKTINESLLVKDTIRDETTWSRLPELGITVSIFPARRHRKV